MSSRMLGLSSRSQPEPLLRRVSGRDLVSEAKKEPAKSNLEKESKKPGAAKGPRKLKVFKAPIDFIEPEISASEKEEEQPKTKQLKAPSLDLEDSDESDNDRHAKASMTRTSFGKPKPDNSASKDDTLAIRTPRKTRAASAKRPTTQDSDLAKDLGDRELGQSSQGSAPASSGEHFKTSHGFTKPTKSSTMTYGSRFRVEKRTAEKGKGGNAKRFQSVEELPESPRQKKRSLKMVPEDDILSTPPKSPDSLVESNEQHQDELSFSSPGALSKKRPSKKSRIRVPGRQPDQPRKALKVKEALEEPAARPRPLFKLPAGLDDIVPVEGLQDGAAPVEWSDSEDGEKETTKSDCPEEEPDVAEPAASCPWCGQSVSADLLNEFSKGKRLNVRMQTKFCKIHKLHAATEEWKEKGYPTIDWEELPVRFKAHHEYLLEVVNGTPSHYRNKLAKEIEIGKGRAMKSAEENLNPGYYGPRGFDLMCDYLVKKFSGILKQRAVDDRVISGRGPASFIQSVLVAELAVRMIMEDLHLDAVAAVDVMEDSKTLGEMIHEETR